MALPPGSDAELRSPLTLRREILRSNRLLCRTSNVTSCGMVLRTSTTSDFSLPSSDTLKGGGGAGEVQCEAERYAAGKVGTAGENGSSRGYGPPHRH